MHRKIKNTGKVQCTLYMSLKLWRKFLLHRSRPKMCLLYVAIYNILIYNLSGRDRKIDKADGYPRCASLSQDMIAPLDSRVRHTATRRYRALYRSSYRKVSCDANSINTRRLLETRLRRDEPKFTLAMALHYRAIAPSHCISARSIAPPP